LEYCRARKNKKPRDAKVRREQEWGRMKMVRRVSLSFVLLLVGCGVNTVKAYRMQFSLDGKDLGLELSQPYVVVYRTLGNGYCFDEIKSQELHDKLASKRRGEVIAQYQITRDFGHVRGYRVLTVDDVDVKNENGGGGSGSRGEGAPQECF
jgi:hypothetical protein